MTGPFTVIESSALQGTYAVVDAETQCVSVANVLGRFVAEALAGALNSAEAGQPLETTLANLAAGRHA